MKRKATMIVALLMVVASLGLAMPASASASNKGGTQQIGGEAIPVDTCNGLSSLFTFEMTGSLVGCWYTNGYEVVQNTRSGVYQERGTETFVGCLVEDGVEVACGSFDTTYKFTAKFAPDGAEIHGRCQHPLASGLEEFLGATGRVDFKDVVETGQFFYRGHIDLA